VTDGAEIPIFFFVVVRKGESVALTFIPERCRKKFRTWKRWRLEKMVLVNPSVFLHQRRPTGWTGAVEEGMDHCLDCGTLLGFFASILLSAQLLFSILFLEFL